MSASKHKQLDFDHIFKDIDDWPKSWAGNDDDIPVGNLILDAMKPFLRVQMDRNLSKKTLKQYADYLCVFGGEIIRDTNSKEIKVKELAPDFVCDYIDESGGPYWDDASSPQELDRYDSICRRFHKYLNQL